MTYYEDGLFVHDGYKYRPEELYSPECDIPKLRKHLEWVEEQCQLPYGERDWNQRVWADPIIMEDNVCRTYRCFAGNVIHEAGGKFIRDSESYFITDALMPGKDTPEDIEEVARRLLGINSIATRLLFDEDNRAEVMRLLCEAIAGESL